MKKLIYIILISITSSICLTACTEEEITPNAPAVTAGKPSDPF
jgi:hypothetical protein